MSAAVGDDTGPAGSSRSWVDRWAPLGGIAFVAGYVYLFVNPAINDTGETPAEVVANAEDDQAWLVAMMIVALVLFLMLVWFVAGVAARVSRVAGTAETMIVAIGGTAFAILNVTALTIWLAPLLDIEDDPARALAQADAYLMSDDVGWVLLGVSGIAAGIMIVFASLAARGAATVPNWLAWLGVLAGVVSLGTVAFFGIFAWLAWILITSILLLVRRA
jgi:hypothetical protein